MISDIWLVLQILWDEHRRAWKARRAGDDEAARLFYPPSTIHDGPNPTPTKRNPDQ